MDKSFHRYLKIFTATLSVGGLALLFNLILISKSFENSPHGEIVRLQAEKNAIYGTALNPNDLSYKLELVKLRKPKIIALGSSRTMQIREEMFREPFTNCGGVFSTINEGKAFVGSMLSVHQPELVLLGIDYWWFSKKYFYPEKRRFIQADLMNKEKLLKPYEWLMSGKLNWKEYFSIIWHGPRKNSYTNYFNMGMHAIKTSNGFRPDGSYLDVESILALNGDRLEKIHSELKSLENQTNERANHGYGDFIDEDRWKSFLEILSEFKNRNIKVILFLPPIAPAFVKELAKHDRFIFSLKNRLENLNEEFFDFTSSSAVKDNREFSDGWHAGEVVYLRLLDQSRKQSSALRKYIGKNDFGKLIARFSGKILVFFREEESLLFRDTFLRSE